MENKRERAVFCPGRSPSDLTAVSAANRREDTERDTAPILVINQCYILELSITSQLKIFKNL